MIHVIEHLTYPDRLVSTTSRDLSYNRLKYSSIGKDRSRNIKAKKPHRQNLRHRTNTDSVITGGTQQRKGKQQTTRETDRTHTKEQQQQRKRQTKRPTQEAPLSPPPRRRVKLYVRRQATTRTKNKQPTTEGREGGPPTRRDRLYTAN